MADHIQIGDVSPRIQYVANGAQAQFTYPFPIFAAADMEVYLDAAKQGTGFTVVGAGASAGGSVTFAAAPASGVVVTLRRQIAIKRTSDFQESGEFRARAINDELDYQTAALQQVSDDVARSVRLSPTDAAADLTLPDKAARAGRFLACDADGKIIGAAGPANVPVSEFAATLLDDADAGAARTTLGLGTAAVKNAAAGSGHLLPANGDGSSLTNLPLDQSLASDIRLNALAIAHLNGDRLNMVNGWADPLKDETDIETAQNVNATFVAGGGGYYHNRPTVNTPSASGLWTLPGGSGVTFSGTTVTGAANTGNAYVTASFTGDFSVNFTPTNHGYIGFAPEGGVGSLAGNGANQHLANAFDVQLWCGTGTTRAYYNGVDQTGATLGNANALVCTLKRVGTTVSFIINGVTVYTWAQASAGNVKVYISCDSGTPLSLTSVSWDVTTAAADMTVVSKAVVAASIAPTVGRLHLQIKDITGGSTVNTDFKGYISRDNGTTYTQGTLALAQTLADATKAYEFNSLDISAQPSGTAPRFKFTTHNNKEIQLHGAIVQWN